MNLTQVEWGLSFIFLPNFCPFYLLKKKFVFTNFFKTNSPSEELVCPKFLLLFHVVFVACWGWCFGHSSSCNVSKCSCIIFFLISILFVFPWNLMYNFVRKKLQGILEETRGNDCWGGGDNNNNNIINNIFSWNWCVKDLLLFWQSSRCRSTLLFWCWIQLL